ncbi:hypothetical protein ACFX15_010284 [Malus domestica]
MGLSMIAEKEKNPLRKSAYLKSLLGYWDLRISVWIRSEIPKLCGNNSSTPKGQRIYLEMLLSYTKGALR